MRRGTRVPRSGRLGLPGEAGRATGAAEAPGADGGGAQAPARLLAENWCLAADGIAAAGPRPACLRRVLAGEGDVSSAGRGDPDHDAGAGLLEFPAFGLFEPVAESAERR